jgi:hypothetical protein
LPECGLYVGYADVEESVTMEAVAAADPAANARAVFGCDQVEEPVAIGLGHLASYW